MAQQDSTRPAKRAQGNGKRGGDATRYGHGGELHQVAERGGPVLTTQQGVPVGDDQNSLRVGERGPQALEDFHFREKIFHFDHERIPERVVHARGYGAHGLLRELRVAGRRSPGRPVPARRRADRGVRPLLHRGGQQGLGRPRPRRARLRREAVHEGGQLGSRRQQHPGVLHPGRDQVPGPGPRREARARSRLPPGAVGARQLLGLRLADARVDAHADVGDVRPGDPAVVPLHGGLRRPHLPLRQRRRRVDVRQVPLEAEARPAVGAVGRGGQDQRRRSRLPPARPVDRDRAGRLPGVGARRAAVRRRVRRQLRLRRARRHQADPRGAHAGPPDRPAGARPERRQLLRRDRAGGVLHAEHRARHRLHQRPAAAGPQLLVSRHAVQAARRPELHLPAGERAALPVRPLPAGRAHGRWPTRSGGSTTSRTRRRATPRGPREDPERGFRSFPAEEAGRKRRLRPESFADHYSQARQFFLSQQPDRAAAHHRRVRVRAEQGRARRDPRADGRQPAQRRRGPRRQGRRRARPRRCPRRPRPRWRSTTRWRRRRS